MISIIESIAQSENKSRSENIKWGIKQRAADGTSKLTGSAITINIKRKAI